MSVPTINAQPRTSIEIKDSCDCSCGSSCWPKKKHKHIPREKSTDLHKRVDEVAGRSAPPKVL